MSFDQSEPIPSVRVSPGTIPEAEQLEHMAFGLMAVRERVDRETAGAVSPPRQLTAVDQLLQRNHEAIAAALRAASQRHERVLDAGDAFRLLLALVEHATLAYYWLRLGQHQRRVPPTGGRVAKLLSVKQTVLERQSVLTRINTSCHLARELIAQLEPIAPPGTAAESSLVSLSSETLCVPILAALLVWHLTERRPMARATLEAYLGQIEPHRTGAGNEFRSESDRDLLLQTAGTLYALKGCRDRSEVLLRERLELAKSRPDWHARVLLELLERTESNAERLTFLRELRDLASSPGLGEPFSDERIGRLSTFKDYLWGSAAAIERGGGEAGEAIRLAFSCHSRWLYAHDEPGPKEPVWIITDWAGRGQVCFGRGEDRISSAFNIDLEEIERLHSAMERLAPSDSRPMRTLTRSLDQQLGPLLTSDLKLGVETRLVAGGPISRAPILMTTVGDKPLGACANVAFAHPNPRIRGTEPLRSPIELLVIDETFGEQSAAVAEVLTVAAKQSESDLQILAFNTATKDRALSHEALAQALTSAQSAVIFAHFDNPLAYAQWASMVTGETTRFRTGDVAALNLTALKELTVVGCGSGRSNPFLGDASFAHAAADAGVTQVIYSIWPISAKRGADFVTGLSAALNANNSAIDYLASTYAANRARAAAFAVLRP